MAQPLTLDELKKKYPKPEGFWLWLVAEANEASYWAIRGKAATLEEQKTALDAAYDKWAGAGKPMSPEETSGAERPTEAPELFADEVGNLWYLAEDRDSKGKVIGWTWKTAPSPKQPLPEQFALPDASKALFWNPNEGEWQINPAWQVAYESQKEQAASVLEREHFEYQKQQDAIKAQQSADVLAAQRAEAEQERAAKLWEGQEEAWMTARLMAQQAGHEGGGQWATQAGESVPLGMEGVGTSVSTAPVDWLGYWRKYGTAQGPGTALAAKQQPTMWPGGIAAPVAAGAEEAMGQGLTQWVSPDALAAAQAGIDMNRQQVPDVSNPGQFRPESDAEYFYRTQTVPMRDIQRGYVAGAKIEGSPPGSIFNQPFSQATIAAQKQGAAGDLSQWFAANLPQRAYATAPIPDWARQFITPTRWNPPADSPYYRRKAGDYIPIGQLGKTQALTPRPVGAQTWQTMLPSERQGLRGLVEASGKTWEDYAAESQKMWPTEATRGARRRTRIL